MAKPYSEDLRARVVAAIADGETCRSIAERFDIAPSTVVKWARRVRETGSSSPAKFGGHRTCSLAPHRAFLLAQIDEVPHLTLHRLKDLLPASSVALSRLSIEGVRGAVIRTKEGRPVERARAVRAAPCECFQASAFAPSSASGCRWATIQTVTASKSAEGPTITHQFRAGYSRIAS